MASGAVFHLDLARKTVPLGEAHSASNYRARTADHAQRGGHNGGGLVGWTGDREALWTAAESAEIPKRQRVADLDRRAPERAVARSLVIALPDALPASEREKLARGMALWLRDRHGVAVQWDVHAPDPDGDQRNHHAHLMLTTRAVDANGTFGKKTRDLNDKVASSKHIAAWREEWATRVNRALEKNGANVKVDHRSKRAIALSTGTLTPEGRAPVAARLRVPAATYIARRGARTLEGARQAAQEAQEAAKAATAAMEAKETRLAQLRERAAEWLRVIAERARQLQRAKPPAQRPRSGPTR